MGGSHSTVSATEESLPSQPPLEQHAFLKQFTIVGEGGGGGSAPPSLVGSGQRMYKSFKVRCTNTIGGRGGGANNANTRKPNTTTTTTSQQQQQQQQPPSSLVGSTHSCEVVAVLKVAYLPQPQRRTMTTTSLEEQHQAQLLQAMEQELQLIRERTAHLPHVWPTMAWFGPHSFYPNNNNSSFSGSTTNSSSSSSVLKSTTVSMGVGGGGSTAHHTGSTVPTTAGTALTTATATFGNTHNSTTTTTATTATPTSAAAAATTTTALLSTTTTSATTTTTSTTGVAAPVVWMRPHVYTTLGDRLINRPWLDATEKLFLIHQLLLAVQSLHDVGLVHGTLTTQNIGTTSLGWLVLLDVMPSGNHLTTTTNNSTTATANHQPYPASSFRPVMLPHNDPTEYLYCFSNKKCYLAPERFEEEPNKHNNNHNNSSRSTNHHSALSSPPPATFLTPAMDIFSLGCCLVELILNGEACFDLGQLLEYRKTVVGNHNNGGGASSLTSTTTTGSTHHHHALNTTATATTTSASAFLSQKLQKMESSALRAACRHMLSLDPKVRLSAREYLERLQEQGIMPLPRPQFALGASSSPSSSPCSVFDTLYELLKQLHEQPQQRDSPDARLYYLYKAYRTILYQTMGIRTKRAGAVQKNNNNHRGHESGDKVDATFTTTTFPDNNNPETTKEEKDVRSLSPSDLWTETEALLKELQDFTMMNETDPTMMAFHDSSADGKNPSDTTTGPNEKPKEQPEQPPEVEERTPLEKSCLLIYVQQILSTLRHVQRPATKLVALRLIDNLLPHVSDEARLQRIVPVAVDLLQDSDALVRGATLQTLTRTLVLLTSFPPSDAQVMPQYIFKRVAPLLTDPCLSVRLALAQCMGGLAETAQRFLDISQAVLLVQAVEGNTTSGAQTPNVPSSSTSSGGVHHRRQRSLIDERGIFEEKVTQLLDETKPCTTDTESNNKAVASSSSSNQRSKHATGGTETIVVRSSYQTERSGLAETLSRWVVHICTDQSENASMVKRALLSHALEGLCNFFSLEGVMAFMLPQLLAFLNDRQDWQLRAALFAGLPIVCQIIGRGATEEFVLPCIEIGLVDSKEQVIAKALLCLARLIEHALLSRALVLPDSGGGSEPKSNTTILDCYSAFLIHPSKGIRLSAIKVFCATSRALGSPDGVVYMTPVLRPFLRFQPSWKHLSCEPEMTKCLKSPWTRAHFAEQLGHASISKNNNQWTDVSLGADQRKPVARQTGQPKDPMNDRMQLYLRMLARHTVQGLEGSSHGQAPDSIEGSMKLAQSVVFPRRSVNFLPEWYWKLREKVEREDSMISEASAIRSVSALGNVYGLSIMGPPTEGAADNIVGAADVPDEVRQEINLLGSEESKTMEEAFMGKWESEVLLDPDVVDTSLLLTKLQALRVPTLPPLMGGTQVGGNAGPNSVKSSRPSKDAPPPPVEWKPKMNAMIASSSRIGGHSAPVVRLAVSLDSSFFVSASHDGTCGVWEVPQLENSSGHLERSTVYSGHCASGPTRINDVAMVEGTYSVVTGASNGSIHVWRVDLVSSPTKPSSPVLERRERSRAVGTSSIREANPGEGEILAVSHFTSVSNSVLVYATQKGIIRTWDLRSAEEPFSLTHGPKLGHLSAMALGGDRNWLATGTSRGFITLWDVRFQQPFKLWRHSKGTKINRLAASFVPPPQVWGSPNAIASSRPYVFVGSQSNECAMFDVLSGACAQCFRTESHDLQAGTAGEEIPSLVDVSGRMRLRNGVLNVINEGFDAPEKSFSPSVNCMVGSIGGQNNSYLLTGGSDGYLRSWDFSVPSRSYIISGASSGQTRPIFERVDFDGSRKRLILCRQPRPAPFRPLLNGNQGLKKPEYFHTDSIEDLKIVDNSALISCSRDCTIKVWR
ncbi:hypothetical protein ACA910_018723 [Epithemia clementina (nom. ined.)]